MIQQGKVLVIDVDGTICGKPENDGDYSTAKPDNEFINCLRDYKDLGFTVILQTSRQMRTHNGNVGKINANTLPILVKWLDQHNVPYDEIYVGKPWCGREGFYVDDRAIRPKEFIENSYEKILSIIENGKNIR